MTTMATNDALRSNLATVFVTLGSNRYAMLLAKDAEVNINIETKEVAMLGRTVKGRKATGATIKGKMTIYKATEIFDDVVETFKNTGVMPTFDIQITAEDTSSSVGASTQIYTDCTIDGDILLSKFDAAGDYIEQTIEFYANDFSRAEKYTNPDYM